MGFLTQVNWIAVAIGGIFNMALGALWYGPLFGTVWLKAIGKDANEIESNATMYLLPLLAAWVASYFLAALVAGLGLTLWWQGILMGVILYAGVGATATLIVGTFEDSPRSAWLLYTAYQLIVFGLQGLLFVLWE